MSLTWSLSLRLLGAASLPASSTSAPVVSPVAATVTCTGAADPTISHFWGPCPRLTGHCCSLRPGGPVLRPAVPHLAGTAWITPVDCPLECPQLSVLHKELLAIEVTCTGLGCRHRRAGPLPRDRSALSVPDSLHSALKLLVVKHQGPSPPLTFGQLQSLTGDTRSKGSPSTPAINYLLHCHLVPGCTHF